MKPKRKGVTHVVYGYRCRAGSDAERLLVASERASSEGLPSRSEMLLTAARAAEGYLGRDKSMKLEGVGVPSDAVVVVAGHRCRRGSEAERILLEVYAVEAGLPVVFRNRRVKRTWEQAKEADGYLGRVA